MPPLPETASFTGESLSHLTSSSIVGKVLNLFRRRPRPTESEPGNANPDRNRKRAAILLSLGLVLLVIGFVAVIFLSRPPTPGDGLRYDEFVSDLRAGRIQTATVLAYDRRVVGTYDAGRFWVDYGIDANFTPTLGLIQSARVPVLVDNQWTKQLIAPLTFLMPSLILVDALLLFLILMRGNPQGMFGMGRASGHRVATGETRITFSDIAGVDEAVEELQEIRDYLGDPSKFLAMGARVPSGILLIGPPGCGKTLLARALAGEAGVPYFSISGSDFVEIFVGVGAARIRDLFRQAKEAAPAIIFIDELDAVGRGRTASAVGGQDEREATLNQLLVGLDGFESETGVVVLAATNRPDVLDTALLRPGRFDRRIYVERPDIAGRLGVLKVHSRGKPFAEDVSLDHLARRRNPPSGADLASVVNEAALLAARRGEGEITNAGLSEAVERVLAGPERRSRILEPADKRLIAYHEAGHALVSTVSNSGMQVSKVSVVSRAGAGGFTWYMQESENVLTTRSQLKARLMTLMGGRAAEEVVSGDVSSGAADDLDRASALARRMVCELGMSDRIGPVVLKMSAARLEADGGIPVPWSEGIANAADEEIKGLLDEAYAGARAILEAHRAPLDRLATRLVEVESIEGPDLEELLELPPQLAVRG
ncbi:MAG: ATP-dependent zinc metalloprotease FtsH [Candidatus Dormibacteraceae bacterium]